MANSWRGNANCGRIKIRIYLDFSLVQAKEHEIFKLIKITMIRIIREILKPFKDYFVALHIMLNEELLKIKINESDFFDNFLKNIIISSIAISSFIDVLRSLIFKYDNHSPLNIIPIPFVNEIIVAIYINIMSYLLARSLFYHLRLDFDANKINIIKNIYNLLIFTFVPFYQAVLFISDIFGSSISGSGILYTLLAFSNVLSLVSITSSIFSEILSKHKSYVLKKLIFAQLLPMIFVCLMIQLSTIFSKYFFY